MELYKDFRFEAAHRCPRYPRAQSARACTGTPSLCDLPITGEVDPATGWIMDFDDIKQAFEPLLEQLDHHYLNDIEGWKTPPASILAQWIWSRLNQPCQSCQRLRFVRPAQSAASTRAINHAQAPQTCVVASRNARRWLSLSTAHPCTVMHKAD